MKKFGFFLLLQLILAAGGHAQSVHLTPVSFGSLPRNTVLLTIQRPVLEDGDEEDDEASPLTHPRAALRIYDGKYYILTPNNVDQEELGDGTIGDFVQYMHGKHEDLTLTTRYPEIDVSELKEGTYEFGDNNVIEIGARQGRPSVAAALAVGFIANEVRATAGAEANTLMRNAGLDLDLVATKPFNDFTVRTRVGFHSSEPVPVQEEGNSIPAETEPGVPSAAQDEGTESPTDPRAVVEGAEAIAVGVELAYHFPVGERLDKNQVHMSFAVDGSQFWASPEAYVFPTFVPVNGERRPIGEVFSEEEISNARNRLDRIVPLGTLMGGGRLLFGRHNDYVFYVLADVGYRQYLARSFGVRYRVDRDADPPVTTPVAILTRFEREWEPITRLGLGVRLISTVDFKVDVVAPLSGRVRGGSAQPVLRIQLATPGVKFGN